MARPPWRHGEVTGNGGPPSHWDGHQVTEVSVIPCRLIGGLHERINDSPTVPCWKPANPTSQPNSLGTPVGKRRPCGALLQPPVALQLRVRRVGGRLRSALFGGHGAVDETPPILSCRANRFGGTAVGGQFGWGATLPKRYRERPKVGSGGSELRRRVQGQKPA